MRRRPIVGLALAALGVAAGPAAAVEIAPLLDADGRVRAAHRRELLRSTSVDDLAALRDAVTAAYPGGTAPPALETALRKIVYYAHLRRAAVAAQTVAERSGLGLPPGYGGGFVGISDPSAGVVDGAARAGAVVWDPIPGFVASATLEEGDVIVGVAGVRDSGSTFGFERIFGFGGLSETLRPLQAGFTVRLTLQRGGGFVYVDVPLDRRIGDLNDTARWLEGDAALAADEAGRRWAADFAPLFEPAVN